MSIRSALSDVRRDPASCGHGWRDKHQRCVMCGSSEPPLSSRANIEALAAAIERHNRRIADNAPAA